MVLRSLFLAALFATGAAAQPIAQRSALGEPGWIVPVQDRRDDRRQEILSLRDVVESVRARYGGELISARLEDGARPIYVLRWRMPNNEIRDFRVDAVSGR